MSDTPRHRKPDACYVCGWPEADHSTESVWQITGHKFWSNADAAAEFAAQDARMEPPVYSDGTRSPEANYVAQHRPY